MIDKTLSQGLHLIANGVFVISARHEGQVRGFTATWVSQASFEHPLVMISVSKWHDTYPLIEGSNKFVLNVLGASEPGIGRHFGRKKDATETDAEYFRVEEGQTTPILKDAIAALKCNVVSRLDAMDHTIFLGEVVSANVFKEEDPLIYWRRGRYAKPQRIAEVS